MRELLEDSVSLVHYTKTIPAIKKLVYAHDIVHLNLEVTARFGRDYVEYKEPVWDLGSLEDLSKIRRELLVYHRLDFTPEQNLALYGGKMARLFRLVSLRLPDFRYVF